MFYFVSEHWRGREMFEKVCRKVAVIRKGRIVAIGRLDALLGMGHHDQGLCQWKIKR
jgi:hypothetical protein